MSRVAIIGAGAWGTALGIALARQGRGASPHDVRLWAFEKEVCDSIAATRTNDMFLPGHPIPAELSATVQREFSDPAFRVYTNDDVAGVELGGALKNVVAIAAGVCEGLGMGHNTVAALITRGLAEITRLVVACGGRRETMLGLAGMGDLVLTCTGGLSRNRSVGVELGRGRRLSEIIAGMHGMVAEGVLTTHAALGLARARGVEMPITQQMNAILHEGKSPSDAIQDLMTRSAKSEVAFSG